MATDRTKKVSRWYFGGLASAGAACCTHPLDLLKVHLQTSGKEKSSLYKTTANIVRNQGVLALYSGLSASLMRQLTYSTTRFAIYDVSKVSPGSKSAGLKFEHCTVEKCLNFRHICNKGLTFRLII